MPIILIIVGGLVAALSYWFRYGGGMQVLNHWLHDLRNAGLRRASEARFRAAPVRAIREPVDAAGVLMHLVAAARGTPTPEQEAAIETELGRIVEPGDDLARRLAFVRHAARQAAEADTAIRHLGPLLRERLEPAERADLQRMLASVARVHGGPTERQERLIAQVMRRVSDAF